MLSAENQKGVNDVQQVSLENQKGAYGLRHNALYSDSAFLNLNGTVSGQLPTRTIPHHGPESGFTSWS